MKIHTLYKNFSLQRLEKSETSVNWTRALVAKTNLSMQKPLKHSACWNYRRFFGSKNGSIGKFIFTDKK